jgi:hypothetical protein
MAQKPETTFIGSVHKYLPADLYRMKNDLWIEYKFITPPKRPDTLIDLTSGTKPELSHLQQDWLKRRHVEGRNVAVIIGCSEGGVWLPGLSWTLPLTTAAFRGLLMTRANLAGVITSYVS